MAGNAQMTIQEKLIYGRAKESMEYYVGVSIMS